MGQISAELKRSIRKTGGKARLRMSGGETFANGAKPTKAETDDHNEHADV